MAWQIICATSSLPSQSRSKTTIGLREGYRLVIIMLFASSVLNASALEITEIRSHLVCFESGRKLTELDRWNALSFKMGHMDLAAD